LKKGVHLLTSKRHYAKCFDRNSHCDDPKGGDLRLSRLKPEEILVEGRMGVDVQITP